MRLAFGILGPLEVRGPDGPLPLGAGKQRVVLALLVLDAGRVVSAERLIDVLWGERPPARASTALQNAVSQLRKLLGSETIATESGGYILRIEPDQIDATRFERLLERARSESPDRAARTLREALDLWRGPALADVLDAPIAAQASGRLEELRLVAREALVDADLELGRSAELVGELEGLVAEQPLRERPRAQLMLALYRSGRQAEALDVFQAARRTLVDELGIEP
ncbi:MAG: hypothetical protein QOE36_3328, partial [Gaiellaceae bacterium]|nr:hypothetical protein [Gaiellaceae bacterium]